jgi:hypothetical protein
MSAWVKEMYFALSQGVNMVTVAQVVMLLSAKIKTYVLQMLRRGLKDYFYGLVSTSLKCVALKTASRHRVIGNQ